MTKQVVLGVQMNLTKKSGWCPICRAYFENLTSHVKKDFEHKGRYGQAHRRLAKKLKLMHLSQRLKN